MSVPNSFSLTLSNLYLPGLGEGGRHLNNREIGTHCLKQVITGSILNNRTNRSNKKESTNYYLSGIPAKNCRKQSDRTRLRDTLQKKKKVLDSSKLSMSMSPQLSYIKRDKRDLATKCNTWSLIVSWVFKKQKKDIFVMTGGNLDVVYMLNYIIIIMFYSKNNKRKFWSRKV